MPTMTIVVGLPGSGKSHFVKSQDQSVEKFDDACHRTKDLVDGWITRSAIEVLGAERDCIVNDTHFCHPVYRSDFSAWLNKTVPGAEIDWVFFEKDICGCMHNILYDAAFRGKKRVENRARSLFASAAAYQLPSISEYPVERVKKVVRAQVPVGD